MDVETFAMSPSTTIEYLGLMANLGDDNQCRDLLYFHHRGENSPSARYEGFDAHVDYSPKPPQLVSRKCIPTQTPSLERDLPTLYHVATAASNSSAATSPLARLLALLFPKLPNPRVEAPSLSFSPSLCSPRSPPQRPGRKPIHPEAQESEPKPRECPGLPPHKPPPATPIWTTLVTAPR
ncbi:hypothetical protein G7046_g4274 [Stylonectria norvegica]|nr:hypothetical protein G7046_g4274 [Stylonectria norvegica]